MTNHSIKNFTTHRLIKGEDLNHHGTLYAGRSAEWFIESGFIAVSKLINPKNLICVKIHGMAFSEPARSGETVCYTSKVVFAGNTSLLTYVYVTKGNSKKVVVDGFVTFVNVDEKTRPTPHNINITAVHPKDIQLQEEAKKLRKKN